MRLYAAPASLRLRQQLRDAAAVLWISAWFFTGRAFYRTIEHLRVAGTAAEQAGAGLAGRLDSAAKVAGRLPIVGSALQGPLVGAADAGRTLEAAAVTAGSTIHSVALWSGLLVALVPALWLLARYLPGRVAWVREASAASALRIGADDLQLFALRAVATHPLHRLRQATPDPAAALARGDYEALAALELRRLGLDPQAPPS